jgi:hypothetical protein
MIVKRIQKSKEKQNVKCGRGEGNLEKGAGKLELAGVAECGEKLRQRGSS